MKIKFQLGIQNFSFKICMNEIKSESVEKLNVINFSLAVNNGLKLPLIHRRDFNKITNIIYTSR